MEDQDKYTLYVSAGTDLVDRLRELIPGSSIREPFDPYEAAAIRYKGHTIGSYSRHQTYYTSVRIKLFPELEKFTDFNIDTLLETLKSSFVM